MLNELCLLERGLTEYGVEVIARHPDLSQLGKGDVIRVRLNSDGAIDELELLPEKTRGDIWTLRDGNHNGFPGLKTPRALLELDGEAKTIHKDNWKKAGRSAVAKREEIRRLLQTFGHDPDLAAWPESGHRTRIDERCRQLQSLTENTDTAAVPATFERFLKALKQKSPILDQLFQNLIEQIDHDEWLDVVREALVDTISLAVDVAREDFGWDAGDARQIEGVSRAIAATASEGTHHEGDLCALTGNPGRLLEGSFPNPVLPGIGKTYLFSRNKDIPALMRYGRDGPTSFPIDADLVSRFSGALGTITDSERRDKTWRLLPAEAGDKQDLLIAFIVSSIDQPFVDLLAADTENDIEEVPDGELVFERAGKDMIRLWEGITTKTKPGETAHILILRSVDLGNSKAVYDKRPTVQALVSAARTWGEAMAHAPQDICWHVFVEEKPVTGRPKPQAPLSLIALSRKLYIRGGREGSTVPGVSAADAMALFLNEGDRKRRAARILHVLLDRYTVLLAGIAHANLRDQLKDFYPKASTRVDALRTISWIGALLFFLRTKEAYMDDAGFKLGQLLSAVDVVHRGYCADVRKDDMPPALVGNSVFALAGRNPERALALLQARWKPYHAWATRAGYMASSRGTPDKGDRRGWAVRRAVSQARHAAKLCAELQPELTQMKVGGSVPDDAFRAELLLGYLAGLKSKPKYGDSDANKEESIDE